MKKLCGIVIILAMTSCAQHLSYTPTTSYSESDFRDINDEDILKAFEAAPQLKLPTVIAWYKMGVDSLVEFIRYTDSTTISRQYVIPKALIEGYPTPLFNSPYGYDYGYPRSASINFKAVRLLAARAKCDLVVLVSSQFAEHRHLNNWAWLNALLIPTLITPYYDVTYKYRGELFVFDVRNGYLYRQSQYTDTKSAARLTVWEVEQMAKEKNRVMMRAAAEYLQNELKELFAKAP